MHSPAVLQAAMQAADMQKRQSTYHELLSRTHVRPRDRVHISHAHAHGRGRGYIYRLEDRVLDLGSSTSQCSEPGAAPDAVSCSLFAHPGCVESCIFVSRSQVFFVSLGEDRKEGQCLERPSHQ